MRRKNRSVCHPQVLRADHSQLPIYYRQGVLCTTHLASAHGVVCAFAISSKEIQNLLIRATRVADFLPAHTVESGLLNDFASLAHSTDQRSAITRIIQKVELQ